MDGFSDEVRSAADELGRIEADRDLALARSRKVIRLSKRVIHGIHTGSAVEDDVAGLEAAMAELMSVEAPEVRGSSLVQDAAMEYAEAMLLLSLVTSGRVPSHSDLGISAAAWVLGLADCVGELRRILTRDLMDGNVGSARATLEMMEGISEELMLLDVPDAVAPVRRKQDIVRGIMDRTRSDMTIASMMSLKTD